MYRNGVFESENFPSRTSPSCSPNPTPSSGSTCAGRRRTSCTSWPTSWACTSSPSKTRSSEHQRPKLDHYESHLFLSSHAVRVDESGELDKTEIDAFISQRWIITVRKDDGFSMEPVLSRWDRSADLAKYGVSFLLYGLLDVIVDGYFETVQVFDDFYDEISEASSPSDRSIPRSSGTGSRCARRWCSSTAWWCRCARR